MSPTQKQVLDDLRNGCRLWWFGDNGPEMTGKPFWPQKRTVRAMLRDGLLRWKPWASDADKKCGKCELEAME
jgi:hypothetical protein